MASIALLILWHALATALVLVAGLLVHEDPVVTLSLRQVVTLTAMAAGYPVAVILIMTLRRSLAPSGPMTILAVFSSVYAVVVIVLFAAGMPISFRVLAGSFVSAVFLFALFQLVSRYRILTFAALGIVFASTATLWLAAELRMLASVYWNAGAVETKYLSTVLHKVKATYHRKVVALPTIQVNGRIRSEKWWGGALSRFGERYLLATGDGRIFVFE